MTGRASRTTVFLKGCPAALPLVPQPRSHAGARRSVVSGGEVHPLRRLRGGLSRGRPRDSGDGRTRSRARAAGPAAPARGSAPRTPWNWWAATGRWSRPWPKCCATAASNRRSGGGLTLSGGEPLLQIDFTVALLEAARREGIDCCIETSGFAPWQHLERVLPLVDLFLYDCKETDPQRHQRFTGRSNRRILANLRRLHDARGRHRPAVPHRPPAATTPGSTLPASRPWPEGCLGCTASASCRITPWAKANWHASDSPPRRAWKSSPRAATAWKPGAPI